MVIISIILILIATKLTASVFPIYLYLGFVTYLNFRIKNVFIFKGYFLQRAHSTEQTPFMNVLVDYMVILFEMIHTQKYLFAV